MAFHSRLNQEERIKRYNDFKAFNKRIMVSTDVFGRGIDIEKIKTNETKVGLEVWIRRASDNKLTTVGWASCVIPD